MFISKWRVSFYCFCLVTIGLTSHTVNTISAYKKTEGRAIASKKNVPSTRVLDREVLINLNSGIIYKRTRYMEVVRNQVKDNKEVLAKIKAKDAQIILKAKEIKKLKGKTNKASVVITAAIREIKGLRSDKSSLQSELSVISKNHTQERKALESDITSIKSDLASEKKVSTQERKKKVSALKDLEIVSQIFESVSEELNLVIDELNLAEIEVLALSDDLVLKENLIKEQLQDIENFRVAECKQQKQLKEFQEQLQSFEDEKSEMDEVIAALKKEREETKKARKKEKEEIAALLNQFSMFANISASAPSFQMPGVSQNPLTDPNLVDWNQYMMLAAMGNMRSSGAYNPFEFRVGNRQMSDFYYSPNQMFKPYRSFGGPFSEYRPSSNSYYGSALGFGLSTPDELMSRPDRGPAFFQF